MENTVLVMRAEESKNKIRYYNSYSFMQDLITEYKQSHPKCLDKTAINYANNVIMRLVRAEDKILTRYNKRVKKLSKQHSTQYHTYSTSNINVV